MQEKISLDKVSEVAQTAAVVSGKYLMKNFGKPTNVSHKNRTSIVTDIDKESERMIFSRIKKYFPNHNIIAEENEYENGNSDFSWVIDPLDGTYNYTAGFPFFNVSIGFACKNEVVAGVVYDPFKKELFSAAKGKGAFLNREKIRVSKIRLENAGICVWKGCKDSDEEKFLFNVSTLIKRVQTIRVLSAEALELCYVGCGRFDANVNNGSNPWDYAAGSIIASEAGAMVTNFSGKPWNIKERDIVVANPELHGEILKLIGEKI